jgi:ABC-type sugar transport system permease subunit
VTLPLLTPIIAVVMTFSVLFTFTDFQLIYVLTRGGPLNATHLMATLSFQRAIPGGALGEGAALATYMIPSCWQPSCSRTSACNVAAGNKEVTNNGQEKDDQQETQGMDFLQSTPRRWVTIYIPLLIFLFVLLFPFYWMVITAFKPDGELLSQTGNPFWVMAPTLAHFKKLLFDTPIRPGC